MQIELAAAVGWVFLAIFAVLALISILDMLKVIELRDSGQRKWIFRSVLGTAVLSVGGLGQAYYDVLIARLTGQGAQPQATASATASATGAPTATSTPAAKQSPDPDPRKQDPPEPVENCGTQAPTALRDWAQAELGERPDFTCLARERYPRCVATLQGRSAAENSSTEARECAREIETYRRNQIAPVLVKKSSYQVNLDSAEANSRSAGTPEELARREYVVAEIARMNGTEWQRFVASDRESLRDLGACNSASNCTLPQ